VLAKEVVGVSSVLASVGRPKSSCSNHEEDAQGDDSGASSEEDEEEDGVTDCGEEEEKPSERRILASMIRTNAKSSAIGEETKIVLDANNTRCRETPCVVLLRL